MESVLQKKVEKWKLLVISRCIKAQGISSVELSAAKVQTQLLHVSEVMAMGIPIWVEEHTKYKQVKLFD